MKFKEFLNYSEFKKDDVYTRGKWNPGLFDLDKKKLKKLKPQSFSLINMLLGSNLDTSSFISTQLNDGDIQTAVVVSCEPLLVACYTEEFDAVVLQCYPTELGKKKKWEVGTRLVATATYNGFGTLRRNKDIFDGPMSNHKFKSFGPIIADLYTSDIEYLERKKAEIPEDLWDRTLELGNQYMIEHPGIARNGLGVSFNDAKDISKIKFNSKINFD